MSITIGRALTLTNVVIAALAQGAVQTTTDGRMSAMSSTTSATSTTSVISLNPSAPTQTGATEVRYHKAKAGAGGFHFEPAELTNVSVGDVVTFEFYPPDHSVARAEFGKPIFYYCAAPDSCKGKQMVGVINPNATQTLHDQQLAAARADYQLAPGDPVPNEASSTSVSTPSASSQGDLSSNNEPSSKLSTAAIVGITVGVILFLTLCAGLLFFLVRKARMRRRKAVGLHTQTSGKGVDPVNSVPVELGVDGGNVHPSMTQIPVRQNQLSRRWPR
ncbi:extracellular serine-rich [Pyrenophora seminiperda CCB06]|uniref:Extracellular serine-rich n=1 Tax=Pyrenophora seminiperda CCB06 TaxID=1302712 RepID=A0A3M7LZM2_9PLEO|nr:extracellular serine-rich [Pyrenophora seminiperda CCB06]